MSLKTKVCSSVVCAAAGILAVSSVPCLAQQPTAVGGTPQTATGNTTVNINDNVVVVSGRLSLGLLNGEANEIVYSTTDGRKVSHLQWDLENVAMVGFGGSVAPTSWLNFNGDVWINISEGTGSMDDYDWLVAGLDWTHWSHHEDTDVDKALLFDINAEVTVLQQEKTTVFGILGYKHDTFEWTSRGGDFTYSVNGFRDTIGSFTDGLEVISYEQKYSVPYIGIGFKADLSPIQLSGRIIGSAFVDVEDRDNHFLRNLLFEESFETGSMWAIDVAASYPLTEQLKVMGSFHYQDYAEVKGSTTVTDLTTGNQFLFPGDAAGADSSASIFALSLVCSL